MSSIEKWLAKRPECIQKLAAEFPIGTSVLHEGVVYYLLGYTEGDMLIFSWINPSIDYKGAHRNRFLMCASHLRSFYVKKEGKMKAKLERRRRKKK